MWRRNKRKYTRNNHKSVCSNSHGRCHMSGWCMMARTTWCARGVMSNFFVLTANQLSWSVLAASSSSITQWLLMSIPLLCNCMCHCQSVCTLIQFVTQKFCYSSNVLFCISKSMPCTGKSKKGASSMYRVLYLKLSPLSLFLWANINAFSHSKTKISVLTV